jgi:hypothetical protein
MEAKPQKETLLDDEVSYNLKKKIIDRLVKDRHVDLDEALILFTEPKIIINRQPKTFVEAELNTMMVKKQRSY